jgi:hypothetical protein
VTAGRPFGAALPGVWRAPHGQRLLDSWPRAIAVETVLASIDHTFAAAVHAMKER